MARQEDKQEKSQRGKERNYKGDEGKVKKMSARKREEKGDRHKGSAGQGDRGKER